MRNQPLATWGQYFTSSLGLAVTGLACGTVATVATIYGSPFVAVAFAATGAVALNSFVIKEIKAVKQLSEDTEEKLKKKCKEEKINRIHDKLIEPERASNLVNLGIGSGVVGIFSAASSAVVGSVQASLQDPSDNNLKNSGAALAITGGTAILVGFTALTVLGNRAGKLKDELLDAQNSLATNPVASGVELSKRDDKSQAATRQ